MKEMFKDFLFSHHILVNDEDFPFHSEPFLVLVSLGQKFGIRINKNAELAHPNMIKDVARCLGEYVPEAFYRGFPDTVRALTPDQLCFDQLYHYTQTYGMGWFRDPGHSVVEHLDDFEKIAYNEYIEPKTFDILKEDEAVEILKTAVKDLLASNRPLNDFQMTVAKEAFKDFGMSILPEKMPCKDTVIHLLYESGNLAFCKYLVLSDVMKLLAMIQWERYRSENLKKLNLKNQDRKFITMIIDWFFMNPVANENPIHYRNVSECAEKRKLWCGLLHHIHYKAKTATARWFIDAIRNGELRSEYSLFESFMNSGDPVSAAKHLQKTKGSSVVLRNLNYILSRCSTDEEIKEVLSCLE